MAKDSIKDKLSYVRAKKLFVLAALEVERYKEKNLKLDTQFPVGSSAAAKTQATLASLMEHDKATSNDVV